jgi:hypothetical protein
MKSKRSIQLCASADDELREAVQTLIRHLENVSVVAVHYWATLDGEISDDVSMVIREADLAAAEARRQLKLSVH